MGRTVNRTSIRGPKAEAGFTLIELLVVILIIGILAAIATPMYLNQQKKGREAAIKSDLHNADVAEEAYFSDHSSYTANVADLTSDAVGFHTSPHISVTIHPGSAGIATTFCIEAAHDQDAADVWHINSGDGSPNPESGSCS